MTTEPSIRVDRLGKKYHLGALLEWHPTLQDRLMRAVRKPFSWLARRGDQGKRSKGEVLWAIRNVSFEVHPGEVIGVIGANGAGKSTLLKLLSRITAPTEGRAELRGRVGSLLEVGTGFHPELTGRENIFLNGAILGMRRRFIVEQFDRIVAFAELERFIDTPVKHYSSGMYVRLAFAVAAHLEPEILLIDEVLAVGDAAFQQRCLGKVGEIAAQGRTVLFVSHNMSAINRLCRRCLFLQDGEIAIDDATEKALARYLSSHAQSGGHREWPEGVSNRGSDELALLSASVLDHDRHPTETIDFRNPFAIEITYRITKRLPFCRVGFILSTTLGDAVFESYDTDADADVVERQPGTYRAVCRLPARLLTPGGYVISLNAGMPGVRNLAQFDSALTFTVLDTEAAGSLYFGKRKGVIRSPGEWTRSESGAHESS